MIEYEVIENNYMIDKGVFEQMSVKEWATPENVRKNLELHFSDLIPMNLTLNAYETDEHLHPSKREHIGNDNTFRRVYIGKRLKGKYKGLQCLIIADDWVRIYRPLDSDKKWIYE